MEKLVICLLTVFATKVHKSTYLNIVVRKGATVFELLASKDQTLLVRRNALLVLTLGLDVVDGIRRLHLKGDGLSSEGLDEDLHDGVYRVGSEEQ